MNIKSITLTAALLAASTTGGCARVQAGLGFDEVARTAEERTGSRIHWNQGTPADAAVKAEVARLLAEELTPESAVQVALLNNRNLQATYEELNIAQADLVAAGLLGNPVFDAEARLPLRGRGTSIELAVVQDFLSILYLPLRKAVAGAAFEAAKLRAAGAVIDLAGQVRTGFYAAQASEQLLAMRKEVLAATEASYTLARRLRAAGNTSGLELANERALYEQSRLDLREAELDSLRTREHINALLGLWGPQTGWPISARLPEPPEETESDGLERRAVERSIDLAITRYEIERAARELGIARPLALFPDAGLGVSAEREREGDWGLGPAVSLPLPIFNQGQPAVASAQAVLRSASERYAAQAVTLRSQMRTAQAAVSAARERAQFYARVLLPLRGHILEQTQLQYNAMQAGAFQLLQAKRDQIEAGSEYIRALRDYWIAHAQREQLLSGRMTPLEGMTNVTSEPPSPGPDSGRGAH
jgi:cobalt-zinc-cadmium efflux system outer membrane protein